MHNHTIHRNKHQTRTVTIHHVKIRNYPGRTTSTKYNHQYITKISPFNFISSLTTTHKYLRPRLTNFLLYNNLLLPDYHRSFISHTTKYTTSYYDKKIIETQLYLLYLNRPHKTPYSPI